MVVTQGRIRGGEGTGSAHLDFLGQLRSSILERSGPGARSQCDWGVLLELWLEGPQGAAVARANR